MHSLALRAGRLHFLAGVISSPRSTKAQQHPFFHGPSPLLTHRDPGRASRIVGPRDPNCPLDRSMMNRPPRRRLWLWLGLGAGVFGLVLAGTMAVGMIQAHRLQVDLERVGHEMDAGRWSSARKELTELARRWPAKGEVFYLLGRCEEALDRPERALAAWERIPSDDPSYPRAAESTGSVLMNLGRYAPAESCLLAALRVAAPAARHPLLRALARLLRLEGRALDVSDAVTAAWVGAPDPGEVLQDLWKQETEPVP